LILGLVGQNGVAAAVCGNVYASPPARHVVDALKAIYSQNGTLIYCNNYTGDRLNFGMGVERFKANLDNSEAHVALVYVDDDVSLEGNFGVTTGRRGLAGGMLILHVSKNS
jgi:dihydroxyacetone kinase